MRLGWQAQRRDVAIRCWHHVRSPSPWLQHSCCALPRRPWHWARNAGHEEVMAFIEKVCVWWVQERQRMGAGNSIKLPSASRARAAPPQALRAAPLSNVPSPYGLPLPTESLQNGGRNDQGLVLVPDHVPKVKVRIRSQRKAPCSRGQPKRCGVPCPALVPARLLATLALLPQLQCCTLLRQVLPAPTACCSVGRNPTAGLLPAGVLGAPPQAAPGIHRPAQEAGERLCLPASLWPLRDVPRFALVWHHYYRRRRSRACSEPSLRAASWGNAALLPAQRLLLPSPRRMTRWRQSALNWCQACERQRRTRSAGGGSGRAPGWPCNLSPATDRAGRTVAAAFLSPQVAFQLQCSRSSSVH